MPASQPTLSARLLVLAGLAVAGAAALVLLARYGLHRMGRRLRRRR
ncbi:hypothetical protein [Geodermatophilus sp. SYSU D00815]